jgi:hypothetical protein
MDSRAVYYQRVVIALDYVENFSREELRGLGFSYSAQSIALVAISVLLIIAMIGLIKGWLRFVFALLIFVFALHVLIPVLDSMALI